jgi:hypothetical protein
MRPQRLTCILLLLVIFAGIPVHDVLAQKKDNLGKEFYLAFGRNDGQDETETNFTLYITSPVAAKGHVEVTWLTFYQDFTTTPGAITTIELPNVFGNSVECYTSEVILHQMGVHVVADTEVAVYGMSHKKYSSDAFMALPVDVLGTEYRTMNYQTSTYGGFGNGDEPGEFWFVAIYDSTTVTITPKDVTAAGKPANTPFKVSLNRGDVYVVMGDEQTQGNDLTGSLIESDLPLAVFSGHARAVIPEGYTHPDDGLPSRDHLVEQLPPVSAWGDSALVIPYATSKKPDLVRIVSAEDNNQISIDGVTVTTLNSGDFFEIVALKAPTVINATNPILVGQYMHTSEEGVGRGSNPYGDPALALVYPVEQFATSYTFISVVKPGVFTGNFVNVVAEAGAISGMILDGNPIAASQFSAIAGSGYMYAQIALAQGTHNISGPKPFGITVYALGPVDSYAYTGGTLLKTITPFKTADIVIDFGDRPVSQVDLSGYWDTTVYLQNISSDPLTISDFPRKLGDTGNFHVISPLPPKTINAFVTDSMKIRFDPKKIINRRMHTVINAKTEHLRAYVVDVYGRAVLGTPATTSDSLLVNKVDTIYFGIQGENSPPVDSVFYLSDNGSGPLQVKSIDLSGPNVAEFSLTGITDSLKQPQTMPFWTNRSPAKPSRVGVRFTPKTPRQTKIAFADVNTGDLNTRRVVLLAIVDTITACSITPLSFDSLYVCDQQDQTITVTNDNTFTVQLTNITIAGSAGFVVLDPIPIDIPAQSKKTVRVRFAPSTSGAYNATLTAHFSVPTGSSQTITLAGYAKAPIPIFFAPNQIHILPEEDVLFPIYAKDDVGKFSSNTFDLEMRYDPSNLVDVEPAQDYTICTYGYFDIAQIDLGHVKYTYHTLDGSILRGGGPTETMPLVYIKFHSFLNDGEDRLTFSKAVDINFTISFPNSPLPVYCQAQSSDPGRITIDSSCSIVYVVHNLPVSTVTYIGYPSPNPAPGGMVRTRLDIPEEGSVKLELVDAMGQIAGSLINETMKAGRYEAAINTAGVTKLRKLLIVR